MKYSHDLMLSCKIKKQGKEILNFNQKMIEGSKIKIKTQDKNYEFPMKSFTRSFYFELVRNLTFDNYANDTESELAEEVFGSLYSHSSVGGYAFTEIETFTTVPQDNLLSIVNKTPANYWYNFHSGIVLGTRMEVEYEDELVSLDNWANQKKLINKISHGSDAGQLFHETFTRLYPIVEANSNPRIVLKRIFTNKSDESVYIRELGIHTTGYTVSGPDKTLLLAYDPISEIEIKAGSVIEVEYELVFPFVTNTTWNRNFIYWLLSKLSDPSESTYLVRDILNQEVAVNFLNVDGFTDGKDIRVGEGVEEGIIVAEGVGILPENITLTDIIHNDQIDYQEIVPNVNEYREDIGMNFGEFSIKRNFKNESGSSINVGSVGLIAKNSNLVYEFLLASLSLGTKRETGINPIEIADGENIEIEFLISVTYKN